MTPEILTASQAERSPILTVERVAAILEVSKSNVRRLAESGELPARKIGRRWYFSEPQILRLIEGQEVAR